MNDLVGVVLSGGQSRRMGEDKALLVHEGVSLLQRAVDLLSEFTDEIIISGRKDQRILETDKELIFLEDVIPDIGPLGGIYSALKYSNKKRFVFIACDMPFLSRYLIKSLIGAGPGCAVAECRGELQPMCCLLNQDCLVLAEELIGKGDFSVRALFRKIAFATVTVADQKIILDIDTPEDKKTHLK